MSKKKQRKVNDLNCTVLSTSLSAFQSAAWCGRKPSFFFPIMCITFSCQPPSPMPDSLPSGFATCISRWDVYWLIYPQSLLMFSMIWIFFVYLFPWFIMNKTCFLSSIAVPRSLHRLPSHTTATLHLSSRGRWTPPCC